MEQRLNYAKAAPDTYAKLLEFYKTAGKAVTDTTIRNLLTVRVSQINGCAYCIHSHAKEARAEGESEHRLYALNAWKETSFFNERERAALDWAESVTLVSQTHVPDDVYAALKSHFSDNEITEMTMLVAAMNAMNRIGVSFRLQPVA